MNINKQRAGVQMALPVICRSSNSQGYEPWTIHACPIAVELAFK